jgi:hypothetical protein
MAQKVTQSVARPQPVPPASESTPVPTPPAKARDAKNHPQDVHQSGKVG